MQSHTTHSQTRLHALHHQIHSAIKQQGKITFAELMQYALYTPNLGYYCSEHLPFGKTGDFITAPEISPLFGRSLATQCADIQKYLPEAEIIEFGAGTGALAESLLLSLKEENKLPPAYHIVELNPHLAQQQYQRLQAALPEYIDSIHWCPTPPKVSAGIIICNEILDALPFERFRFSDEGLQQLFVTVTADNQIQAIWQAATADLAQALEPYIALWQDCPIAYESEYCLQAQDFLQQALAAFEQGVALFIDYGFVAHEYYHPDRHQGTWLCHQKHLSHEQVFSQLGLCDITAHVNFTYIAQLAKQFGADVAGYCNQAWFLLSNGLLDFFSAERNTANQETQLKLQNAIHLLTAPQEMGELFKVLALSKNYHADLVGFSMRDDRNRLSI
jgi:SAM-dependent MidA family methyltransferase